MSWHILNIAYFSSWQTHYHKLCLFPLCPLVPKAKYLSKNKSLPLWEIVFVLSSFWNFGTFNINNWSIFLNDCVLQFFPPSRSMENSLSAFSRWLYTYLYKYPLISGSEHFDLKFTFLKFICFVQLLFLIPNLSVLNSAIYFIASASYKSHTPLCLQSFLLSWSQSGGGGLPSLSFPTSSPVNIVSSPLKITDWSTCILSSHFSSRYLSSENHLVYSALSTWEILLVVKETFHPPSVKWQKTLITEFLTVNLLGSIIFTPLNPSMIYVGTNKLSL